MDRNLRRAMEAVSGCRTGLFWLLLPFPPVLLLVASVESKGGFTLAKGGVWLGIGVLCIAAFAFQRWQRSRALRFLEWLWENRDAVRGEGAEFDGDRIAATTELSQFVIVVSMLLLCTQHRTAYVVEGSAPEARLGAVFFTLLLGWWGFPGIVWTIAALIRNLGRGSRIQAGDLIAAIEQRTAPAPAKHAA